MLTYSAYLYAPSEPLFNTPAILCSGSRPVNCISITFITGTPPNLIDYGQTSSLTFVVVLGPVCGSS